MTMEMAQKVIKGKFNFLLLFQPEKKRDERQEGPQRGAKKWQIKSSNQMSIIS